MATYYINNGSGNDSSGDGSQGNPYKTLGKVLSVVENASADTIVEITDEATYSEHSLIYRPNFPSSLTIRHTASHLGRPKFDATGAGTNSQFIYFDGVHVATSNVTASIIGIEIETNNAADFFDGTFDNGLEFHISGCFLYGARALLGSFNRSARPVSTIKQSTLFFDDDGAGGDMIQAQNGLEISNCLLTSSAGFGEILKGNAGFGSNNVTASFCTIISRRTNQQAAAVSRWGKLINCVVSSSGPGVQSDDHSFNLVIGNQSNNDTYSFVDSSGNPTSLGTGDIKAFPTFVNGASMGNSPSVAANFALAEGSRGIDEGITFGGITVDITGTVRPQGGGFDMGAFELLAQSWNDFDDSQTYDKKFGSGFEIHGTANKLTTRTFPNGTTGRQAPYFVTIPGLPNLRGRTTPYKNET